MLKASNLLFLSRGPSAYEADPVKICLRPGTTKSRELRSASLVTTRLLVEAVEEASQRPRSARFDILEAVPSCFSDQHGRRRSCCTARLCWISSISVALGRATACLWTHTRSPVMILKARATLLSQSSPLRRTAQKMAVLTGRSCSLRSQAKSPRQCVEDVHLSGPDALNMTRSSIGAG